MKEADSFVDIEYISGGSAFNPSQRMISIYKKPS
jgi:hypothetical protein